ncbi:MAG: class I SAM-dependent RNA methyltransferase [Mycoplasma sp.]|nr:class I SAM-dependent RNA methyltransferase [Mycoplasma sp.]
MILTAKSYNTNGEAICVKDNKVFYVPGLIRGEEAECIIEFEKEKWGRAQIKEIIKKSPNRNEDVPDKHLEIGGYEIFHMNREEQTWFKNQLVIDAFKNNAKENIELEKMFVGKKQLRYRNKITLHNGGFHKRKTNEVIKLDDFLITDIKPKTSKSGEVIIRKLDTTISGHKGDKKFTTDTMLDIEFIVGLNAFYQVNKEVAEAVYSKMMKFLDKNEVVFDLYSGIGTITLIAAKKSKHVYGIERNKASFNSAILNQEKNDVKNITLLNQDVSKFLKKNKEIKSDTFIVDPAREGLGKETCELIKEYLPKKIIYLSCNPGTQAADFNRLKENYEITYAQPFDMFPQTHHIENLIILNKKTSK